jgi:hypothetical protein
VPRADVVASNRPDGGTDKVVSAVVCATIIEIGCFVGAGGGLRGSDDDGGPDGVGGGQGGRWISWTWPICRPCMASRVA